MKKYYYYFLTLCFVIAGALGGFYIGSSRAVSRAVHEQESKSGLIERRIINSDVFEPIEMASGDSSEADSVFGVDFMLIKKSIAMLNEEFIEDLDMRKLAAGAVKGMKDCLKEAKLDFSFIAPIPKTTPEKDLMQAVQNIYDEAMARNAGKITESELAYGALAGVMERLDDPYSVAMDPKRYKMLNEHMSGGNYGGIGIYLERNKKTGRLTVLNVIPDGPAYIAGIKNGDVIMKIDGYPLKNTELELASQKIRGKKGTPVTLLIDRETDGIKEFKILRDIIHENSVETSMKPNKIGYIKISVFGDETGREFSDAMEKLEAEGAEGLLLDLRNNSGGFVSSAIDVCSRLIDAGALIVSVVNPRTGRNEVYRAYGGEGVDIPIAVLVNGNSASASEITAGALKDVVSAKIIGEQTYGKAAVQSIREFKDGGALKFTVARYLTPKGVDIDKKGITPDFTVKMDNKYMNTENDAQIKKALSVLKREMTDSKSSSDSSGNPGQNSIDPLRDL